MAGPNAPDHSRNLNRRAVRTASSEQVRQPIYADALGYWRRYEKNLEIWREQPGDIVEQLPYTVRNAGF